MVFVPLMAAAISITNLITSILLFAHFSYLPFSRASRARQWLSFYGLCCRCKCAHTTSVRFHRQALLALRSANCSVPVLHLALCSSRNATDLYLAEKRKARRAGCECFSAVSIGMAAALAIGLAGGLTLIAIFGDSFLPRLVQDRTSFTPLTYYVVTLLIDFLRVCNCRTLGA